MAVNLEGRERLLVVITLVFLGSLLIFTTIIDPQLKRRETLSNELLQLHLDLTKARRNLLIKDRIENSYSKIESLISGPGNQQQKISDFTRLLDQLYSKLNVRIRSVKILPLEDDSHYQKLSIRIEMVGHVKELLKFVEAVEQHTDPIRIEAFDLTSQETKDEVMVSMVVSKIASAENLAEGQT